jgi:hypothetical protein
MCIVIIYYNKRILDKCDVEDSRKEAEAVTAIYLKSNPKNKLNIIITNREKKHLKAS